MLTLLVVGVTGVVTGAVVHLTTGFTPGNWKWWAIMVPASWAFAALVHVVEILNRRD